MSVDVSSVDIRSMLGPRDVAAHSNPAGIGKCDALRLSEFRVVIPAHQILQSQVKRSIDVVLTVCVLLLLSPLLVLVAVGIKLSSRGPVFFTQERVGLGNRRFRMLKFRSMRADVSTEAQPKGVFIKEKNDPRVTLMGRIIRKTSIDELPQLINVLRGEMSLVGPRPLLADHLLVLNVHDEQLRARMRPGLTGLWQLRDREHASSALSMVNHDLEYIEQFSLWMDFKILLSTVPAVLSCRGAK